MNRKAKLEKALAIRNIPFDEVNNESFCEGVNHHADEKAPLHEALLAVVEALEILNSQLRPIGRYSHQADSALSKIDKVLGDEREPRTSGTS